MNSRAPAGGPAATLRRVPLAALALAAGVLLSLTGWKLVDSQVEHEARMKFGALVADSRGQLQARLQTYYDVLSGLSGLFQTSPEISRLAFHRYVGYLEPSIRATEVRSINFSRRVPLAAKAAFEKEVRQDASIHPGGYPGFAIRPPGARPEYVVLTYVEPYAPNAPGLGLDITADPVRRASVERARDTGALTASERFILASLPVPGDFAVSLRRAVYRSDLPVNTIEERRRAFAGVVTLTFLVRELVSDFVWQNPSQPLQLRIVDTGTRLQEGSGGKTMQDELLYDSGVPAAARATFTDSVTLEFGDRLWKLQFTAPRARFVSDWEEMLPWIALAAGLVISTLLAGLVRSFKSAQLAEAQRTKQEMIEALPNPVFFKDTGGRYLGVNKAWEEFFGIPRQRFVGKTVHDLYPHDPDTANRLSAMDDVLWRQPGKQIYETTIKTADGALHDAVYYKATFAGADGSVAGLIGTIVDITERKRAERCQSMEHAVTRVLAEADTLASAIPKIIQDICETMRWHCGMRWKWDKESGQLRCRDSWGIDAPEIQEFLAACLAQRLTPDAGGKGLVRAAFATGQPVSIPDLTSEPDFRRGALAAKAGLHGGFSFPLLLGSEVHGVMEFFHRDVREPDATLAQIAQSIGSQIGQYIVRKQAEEAVQFVATHDALTGLPNRVLFNQSLDRALALAKRNERRLAVLFIDLDRFKLINDTLGHEAGDTLLGEVARRLTNNLRASDTVARLGGDEFVVLIEEIADLAYLVDVAQKLLEALGESIVLAGHEYRVTASIGISSYPEDADDIPGLLKNADIAMYRVKEQGRSNFQFYSAKMHVHSLERLTMESGLRRALERDELVLHYQPKVDIGSGRITGVEALVRWQHPDLGLVPPGRFIAVAEETGLIVPIGEWVLRTACIAHRVWEGSGLPAVRMAVNLSARQLVQDGLVKDITRVLRETRCHAGCLELEITESMVMHNPARAVALIRQLKEQGIRIAIDDFGTGYSSLAYLKHFPIDSLKIDRSFIQEIPVDAGNMAITQAVIGMAHSLNLSVIAEGVETREQLDFLRRHRCDEMQGFYFSKPLPEAQLTRLLSRAAMPVQ